MAYRIYIFAQLRSHLPLSLGGVAAALIQSIPSSASTLAQELLPLSLRWLKIHLSPYAGAPPPKKWCANTLELISDFSDYPARKKTLFMVNTVNSRRLEERVVTRGCEPIWHHLTLQRNGWWASALSENETRLWLISGRRNISFNGFDLSAVVI